VAHDPLNPMGTINQSRESQTRPNLSNRRHHFYLLWITQTRKECINLIHEGVDTPHDRHGELTSEEWQLYGFDGNFALDRLS
jgi:hypothetical protein